MIWAGISAVINIGVGITLFNIIGFEGLALATTLAAWVNVIGLYFLLKRNGDLAPDRRLKRHLPRIGLASLIMGAGLWVIRPYVPEMGETHIIMDFVWLMGVVGVGILIYAIAATLLRAYDRTDIGRALSRKR